MTDERPRVAILGAGPSGLAAAHHLANSHRVWLFDSRQAVGGVWALDDENGCQAYDWLETNTPTALFKFPGFPLSSSDYIDESCTSKRPYVSGRVAQRYYARFAQEKGIHDKGKNSRLASLNLGTTVVHVKRPYQEQKQGTVVNDNCWTVSFKRQDNDRIDILPFERLVIATGAFSSPSIPDSLHASIQKGIAFHSSSLGSPLVASRLSKAKRVIIIGGGKSSLDLVSKVTRSFPDTSVELVTPSSNRRPSAWPLPHGRFPSLLSRMPQFGACHLSPWAGSRQSTTATTSLEKSRFGDAIRKVYWCLLAWSTQQNFPLLFPATAATPSSNSKGPWRDILRSTTRLFPAPPGLTLNETRLTIHNARLNEVLIDEDEETATINLIDKDGHTQSLALEKEKDIIIACTGYHPSSHMITRLFANATEAEELGIPKSAYSTPTTGDRWSQLVVKGIQDAQKEHPILADLFDQEEFFNLPINTFRLYHHLIPIEQARSSVDEERIARDFAIVGLPQTLGANIVADVQARWLSFFFTEAEKTSDLHLPASIIEAEEETARLVAASLSRYGPHESRQGTAMALELAWYADLLLSDIKSRPKVNHRHLQSFRALSSDDFL